MSFACYHSHKICVNATQIYNKVTCLKIKLSNVHLGKSKYNCRFKLLSSEGLASLSVTLYFAKSIRSVNTDEDTKTSKNCVIIFTVGFTSNHSGRERGWGVSKKVKFLLRDRDRD